MTTKEKRKRVRHIVDIPLQFIVQGRLYQGQIISMTYSSPHFGEKNRIGTIIRVEPQCIGVKFGHSG